MLTVHIVTFIRLSFILVRLISFVRVYVFVVASHDSFSSHCCSFLFVSILGLKGGERLTSIDQTHDCRGSSFLFCPDTPFRLLCCAIFLHLSSYLTTKINKLFLNHSCPCSQDAPSHLLLQSVFVLAHSSLSSPGHRALIYTNMQMVNKCKVVWTRMKATYR